MASYSFFFYFFHRAIIDFLVVILSSRNVKRESIKESIVIRHWIRCCIWSDNTEVRLAVYFNPKNRGIILQKKNIFQNLKKLTKVVVNLKEFQELYAKDAINLINANAPLVELCSAVGKSFRQMVYKRQYPVCHFRKSKLLFIIV